jgi:hypothetical protein
VTSGIHGLAIPPLKSFRQFFTLIIFHVLVPQSPQFVMPVNWPKATNYLILVRYTVPRHQLPYSSSLYSSSSPLETIFSDVWGPAPLSVGGFKYYINFIDDFSKFSWIYLMHDRTEAPRIFLQFQSHVERLLNNKIKCVQSNWGGEYQKIHNTFF